MSVVTETRVQSQQSRIDALRAKHTALSEKIKEEQKSAYSPDLYLSHLKKRKLLLKEQISDQEERRAG